LEEREVSYLHPLLADEGEEDPDEEQLADTTKVATYEREYSRLFAVLLFPTVFASFSLHLNYCVFRSATTERPSRKGTNQ